MRPESLDAECSAFLGAVEAATDAARGLAGLGSDERVSRDEASAALRAVLLLAEKQTEALAALDRLILRGDELNIAPDVAADLRRGRVDLAVSVGITLQRVERAERHLNALIEG